MSDEERNTLYLTIETIVAKEVKPLYRNINWFMTIGSLIIAFIIGVVFAESKDVQSKADRVEMEEAFKGVERDMLSKFDYYQIESDEHRMMQDAFYDPKKASIVFDDINDNITKSLGFKLTTRGRPENVKH